jgi:polyisoprenoid-binding protein YceI
MATLTLGPSDGSVRLLTGVVGPAARMGHRLAITFTDWTVAAEVAAGALQSVTAVIEIDSLSVLSGSGGATPLSPVDKQLIRRNALKALHAAEHPHAAFASREIEQDDAAVQLAGDLSIAGTTKRVLTNFRITPRDGRTCVRGKVPVPQSAFGVKPYSLMMGALQVADEVLVEVELCAPEAP